MKIELNSSYRPPDPKKQLSVRVRGSIHAKLRRIRDFWRERARAAGADVDEIDTTYVVDALLADKTQEELQQFGLPPSPSPKATTRATKVEVAP